MAYYTKEKAKFGGVTGTILPFTVEMPFNNNPSDEIWKKYLPAGFLRCNGDILKASVYPSLAAVIGTGSNCVFAKDPDALLEDEFQLPDLGSKYVRSALASGAYLNLFLEQDPEVRKVGSEVSVTSLIGDEETITYSGNFQVQSETAIPFTGFPIFKSSTGYTDQDGLTEDSFQGHGHKADVGVFTYLGNWDESRFNDNSGDSGGNGDNAGQTEGSNNPVTIEFPEGSTGSVFHRHQINLPSSTELKANNKLVYSLIGQPVSPDGLSSTVTVTTDNLKKLDDAISPYILVEYIIKI
jgi:hypothetical protein